MASVLYIRDGVNFFGARCNIVVKLILPVLVLVVKSIDAGANFAKLLPSITNERGAREKKRMKKEKKPRVTAR